METRRTRPAFLSEEEAASERRRTTEMVRGFLKGKPAVRIGENMNFAVDFEHYERNVVIYGKEIPKDCPFKLAFSEREISDVINLLAKAKSFFHER